jgi:hypothetical protein
MASTFSRGFLTHLLVNCELQKRFLLSDHRYGSIVHDREFVKNKAENNFAAPHQRHARTTVGELEPGAEQSDSVR